MAINLVRIRDCQEHTELAVRLLTEYRDFLYSETTVTPETHRSFIASLPKEDYMWVVERDGSLCGLVSAYHFDSKNRKCEWGRFMVDEDFRGVGSVVEYMVIDFVFQKLGIHKLLCEVLEDNGSVFRMHEKFGFRIEGTLRDHIFKAGAFRNIVYMGMIDSEWSACRERFYNLFQNKIGKVEC